MVKCVLLSQVEFKEREAARRAAVDKWLTDHEATFTNDGKNPWPQELRDLNRSFLPPGSMWECPWYLTEPVTPEYAAEQVAKRQADPSRSWHLSIHYWRDWALIRPPLEIVCPDGLGWCPDSKSSNGDGWIVKGDAPLLSVTPSIWTNMPDGYHGWLGVNGAEPGYFKAV